LLERPISLCGHVTDATSGDPVVATISYAGVVFENGETNTSGGPEGRYHAFLPAGTYEVTFEAEGYDPRTFSNVVITDDASTLLDVAMSTPMSAIAPFGPGPLRAAENPQVQRGQFSFEISAPGYASLRIFDVNGSLVRTLTAGHHAPGRYELSWDGRNGQGCEVAAGSYYYRLQTAGATMSRRLLFMK
jgi:hypothetical protein